MRRGEILALDTQGFHRLRYQEWGSADNERVLICVHGLARNSRDFDDLAIALSRNYRVICPDLPGRGESDWLVASSDYALPLYVQDMVALIARLGVEKVDWVGTSLGGLIGMALAARPGNPIRRLVLNDIGPYVPQAALARIAAYLGDPRFANAAEVETYLRGLYPAFGDLNDKQWQHLVAHGQRECEDGRLGLHYDPAIADNAALVGKQDLDLWGLWSAVSCPQLLIQGGASDVLTSEVAQRMNRENSELTLKTLPGLAHAPSLMEADHIALVVEWLRSTQGC
ncbi:alpha/beta fold hydrolase [Marinobacterium litorale]|uniref:alpha/beta fold hydrolase n=1 Tax=Marinobacterium litorale TaxID=404770 RepID=UPI000486C22A|nr:alpha/beta hydrolase [Marinobacterium litorale]